ncbi:arylformamidase [Azospirillum brasilense]|nr:alpha/beta hydrolase [Azospirillum baldaniorum]TWA78861.1 arylformamidase [Azospirillum brasilense]
MASEALFGGMTAAEIDRQYNFRKLVPEHPAYFARWQAESEAVRARLNGRYDVPTGPHPRQRADVFPAGEGAPVLVFIHGGYWRALSKDLHSFIAAPYVERGVAVVLLGYGLCSEVTMDELCGHAQAGLDWVIANAAGFGGDPRRVVVSGHSAGGHLTAKLVSENRDRVAGGIPISGLYDLEPMLGFEVNEQLRLDPDSARRLSPIHAVPTPAPLLMPALGGLETDAMHRQQADYALAWAAQGNAVREIVEPGADHFSVVDRFAEPGSLLFEAALAMLKDR